MGAALPILGKSRFGTIGSVLAVCLAVQFLSTPALLSADDDGPNYYRIEEDWQLVLLDPDQGRAAPQVATEMSPTGSSSYFCTFQLNYRRLPQYATGGLQGQIWKNNANIAYKSYGSAMFSQTGEVMTWTQYMERTGGTLKFGVSKGSSLPWGDLKEAWMHINCSDDSSGLSGYNSNYSALRSAITYGANRVQLLQLTQVRKYRMLAGVVVCDIETTPRTVWTESALQ